MIRVISFKICPFVQRVTAALEAKTVPYEVEYINLKNKPEWFLEISPNGQVPVLITESGQALFESDAIIEYLNETLPQLRQDLSPEQRAIERAWSYQASKHYLVQCSTQRSSTLQKLQEGTAKLGKAFAKAEKVLDQGPFFNGKALSNVDIAWLPLLHRASIIYKNTCYDFLKGYPKVKAWQKSLLATDIVKQSVAVDFEEAFNQFYLAEETYLGSKRCCTADDCCSSDSSCCDNCDHDDKVNSGSTCCSNSIEFSCC